MFQEKKKFHQIVYSRPTLVLLAVLLVVTLNSTWKMYEKASLAREQKNRLENELESLKARELDLQAKIANLKTERGLEEERRGRFSVARNGEGAGVSGARTRCLLPPTEALYQLSYEPGNSMLPICMSSVNMCPEK